MIRFVVFLLISGFLSLAQAAIQPRIIGGEIAVAGKWPSVVALQIGQYPQGRFCGGNLIAPNWILTAAHCLVDEDGVQDTFAADIIVAAGLQNLSQVPADKVFSVRSVAIHPFFNGETLDADIALLELSGPTSQPVMAYGVNPFVGASATVVGWGVTEVNSSYGPVGSVTEKLREVSLPVVSNQDCNNVLGGITPFMFCAGLVEGGKDSCAGDSGGPLMVQASGGWQQAGIVSFGDGCAKPGRFGVYTRVAMFTGWINNTIAGGDPGDPGVSAGDTGTKDQSSPQKATASGGTMGLELMALVLLFAFRRNSSVRRLSENRSRSEGKSF